jgi:hypothetical protein
VFDSDGREFLAHDGAVYTCTESNLLNLIVMAITVVLLVIMLIGLLRLRRAGGDNVGLTRLLWNGCVVDSRWP